MTINVRQTTITIIRREGVLGVASVGAGREWRAGSSPRCANVYICEIYAWYLTSSAGFHCPFAYSTLSAHLHLYSKTLYRSPLSLSVTVIICRKYIPCNPNLNPVGPHASTATVRGRSKSSPTHLPSDPSLPKRFITTMVSFPPRIAYAITNEGVRLVTVGA